MQTSNCVKDVFLRIGRDIKEYRWIVIAFVLWNIIVRTIFHAFCPFLIIFGIPCAGCGMTRAMWFILTGQVERGIRLNPSAPVWLFFLGYIFVMRYVFGKKIKGIYILLGIAVVISMGIYIYRMVTLFPGNPPLVFYYNCIMERVLPGYISELENMIR